MNRMSVLFFSFILLSITLSQTPPPYGYSGNYAIVTNEPQQIIKGLGVEIQSDSIGSGDHGLPDEVVCVPHDLVDSEKMRFYTELLKGFRYVRLAMGLYLRGLDSSQQHIIERYPGQMESLYNLSVYSGVEGYAIEYWSPPPYWKSTNSYINGGLKSFNESFLDALGDAMIADIDYLFSFNLSVVMWGLQNEPGVSGVGYSSCAYSSANYHTAFKAIAPKVKAKFPNMYIHVDSYGGQSREVEIVNDTSVHQYFDAWTWHRIGDNSNALLNPAIYNNNTLGKDVFSNEYEYFTEATNTSCINTAQNIMNWFTFVNSPTWFWLHALKPTYNSEASGYGLGYWRPWDDNNTNPDHFPNLQKGYWEYNYLNWNSVAGFTKYMGWDAQRFLVKEDTVRPDQRILSFATSDGALVFVLTNRGNYTFTFNISVDNLKGSNTFDGHLYTPSQGDVSLGSLTLDPDTPASRPVEYLSIEFWVQQI